MDALLTAVLGALPQLGGAGLLVIVVVLLLRREGQELARERAAHAEQMAQRDQMIADLRQRLAAAEAEIDEHRRLRRLAEDWAARVARTANAAEAPTWPA